MIAYERKRALETASSRHLLSARSFPTGCNVLPLSNPTTIGLVVYVFYKLLSSVHMLSSRNSNEIHFQYFSRNKEKIGLGCLRI